MILKFDKRIEYKNINTPIYQVFLKSEKEYFINEKQEQIYRCLT